MPKSSGVGLQVGLSARTRTAPRVLTFVQSCALADDEHLEHLMMLAANNQALAISFSLSESARAGSNPANLSTASQAVLQLPSSEKSLPAHVSEQIPWLIKDASLHHVALYWLEELEPSGWTQATPHDIAKRADCSLQVATAVLERLQKCEPSGLFARSLAECLELQLDAQGALNPAMAALLSHLPLLAEGGLSQLAEVCSVSPENLSSMIRKLRGLNPKPGSGFSNDPIARATPDMFLGRDDNGIWRLDRNSFLRPNLSIKGIADASLRAQARLHIRTTEARDALVFRVAQKVLQCQTPFLDGKQSYPSVVTARDLARQLEVHETTVGRIRKHLTIGVDEGRFALSKLFFRGIGSGPKGPVTDLELRQYIQKIRNHTQGKLSDRKAAEELATMGLVVARRTINKYRSECA